MRPYASKRQKYPPAFPFPRPGHHHRRLVAVRLLATPSITQVVLGRWSGATALQQLAAMAAELRATCADKKHGGMAPEERCGVFYCEAWNHTRALRSGESRCVW